MTTPVDFAAAHDRHWSDAELLFGHKRPGNADHLYGFSAECGLKAVMRSLGMEVDSSGDPIEKKYRKHVKDLWPEFREFAHGRTAGRYLSLLPREDPFSDWSHNDRYAAHGYASAASLGRHRDAARTIRRMVQKCHQDGMG